MLGMNGILQRDDNDAFESPGYAILKSVAPG